MITICIQTEMEATVQEANTVQLRFQNALCLYPIQRRIGELITIFRDCSVKELQTLFPALIESIFGLSSTAPGWNLRSITRYDAGETFDAIFRFLHPQGALMDVAYKLLGDVYLKYEYSLSYLPPHFRQLLDQGNIPPYYMDKLNFDPVTRAPLSFLLNSFEFFMFHFAFHLVTPWQVRIERPQSSNETIYLHLSDQYLSHFLPIETSVVLPAVVVVQAAPRSPPPQVQPVRISKLFKTSALKQSFNSTSPTTTTQPHAEIWRSEGLLHIIIYFWLYVPDTSRMFEPMSKDWQETRASGDHLRVVRNIIKHMHYFANNVRNDGAVMDEMRRSIRNVLQVPLYNFLRYNIHHWPLDSSFLLMLETYLSYIQPWRYQRYNPSTQAGESTNVYSTWLPYISENIEAYTAVVSELISRFARMDLSSPRHAHMIYRLAKVLAEPELPTFLRQADYNALCRADQENHVPLFTKTTELQVQELLRSMTVTASIVNAAEKSALENKSTSFMQNVRDWFLGSGSEDYSSSDRQATVAYLEHAIKWLATVFDVSPPDPPSEPGIIHSVQPSLLDPTLAQKRAAHFKYGGNPDLEPIKSTEIASMVRSLHRVSTSLNEMYGPQIAELWHRDDLWGRISQQFLAPPGHYFYFHKTGPGNPAPRVSQYLPPRVCLRGLASRRFITSVLFIIAFPYIFNYMPILCYFTFLLVFIVMILGKALVSPYFERNSTQQEQDSFVPLDVSYTE